MVDIISFYQIEIYGGNNMSDSMNNIELLRDLENDDDFIALKQKYETPNEFTIMGEQAKRGVA